MNRNERQPIGVIPANAGIHRALAACGKMDSRFRGNDAWDGAGDWVGVGSWIGGDVRIGTASGGRTIEGSLT